MSRTERARPQHAEGWNGQPRSPEDPAAPGAVLHDDGVRFRVHATRARSVDLVLDDRTVALERIDASTFGVFVPQLRAGARYRYSLDGGEPLPDPWSRWQPDGPHGASCVVEPGFSWSDGEWQGVSDGKQFIYEMHIGTFTPERTWSAATKQLEQLAGLGITAIELMPVAEFPGDFGWGYDGVQLFAPFHGYGTPHDMRAFIDRAHALGMAVLLDVVYNHLGPDGNYMLQYVPEFLSQRHSTDWGECPDYDGPGAPIARAYVLQNVAYWIREFHIDGVRLDATQDVKDTSEPHILEEIVRVARDAAQGRRILITSENEPQDPVLLRARADGGYGMDALWNDDFHHSARVAATGRSEAYYTDYTGNAQELVSLATRGWLYRGQHYTWQGKRRGEYAPDIGPARLVAYLQNHDQVANSLRGERLPAIADHGIVRALTAYLLLGPSHVLLFQGQEYAAPQPFLYFADHEGRLGANVARGRAQFLQQFETIAAAGDALSDDPRDQRTLERSTLDPSQRDEPMHERWLALHRDLIAIARNERALRRVPEGAVLDSQAFVLRWDDEDASASRLLIVNPGRMIERGSIAEPLIAPPAGHAWSVQWSSDDPRYGGPGVPDVETADGWRIPAHAAVLLRPEPEAAGGDEMPDVA
ncbi:MAG: malto-oligosyltrehalose trehalohydrolase [Longimicrobiales bacterium]